jgi:hypothetical protein
MDRKQFHLTVIVLTGILGLNGTLLLGQIKEWESNVIYSEKQVPFYELPDPLLTVEGKRISTKEEWINIRRPQIMGMFASTIYGRVPEPEFEIRQEFEVLNIDKEFLDGRCTRKQLLATFSNERGKVRMHIAVFTPNDVNGPVPALLNMGSSAKGLSIELQNIQSYGELRNGTPLIHFLDEGLGVVCVEGGEIIRDENGLNETIHELFYKGNQSIPRADEWGVLAGIAWQASRTMDYLETDTDIAHDFQWYYCKTRDAAEQHYGAGLLVKHSLICACPFLIGYVEMPKNILAERMTCLLTNICLWHVLPPVFSMLPVGLTICGPIIWESTCLHIMRHLFMNFLVRRDKLP